MKKEVEFFLNNSLAEPSISPCASPSLLILKPDGSSRFCTDYRNLDKVTLPLINDLVDSIGQFPYVTTTDLLKGYYQIPLSEQTKSISAFITPFGLYQ